MSTEQNKNTIRRIFEEAFNKKDLSSLDNLASKDVIINYSDIAEPVRGLSTFKKVRSESNAAFPDVHFTIEDIIAEGDKVAVHQ